MYASSTPLTHLDWLIIGVVMLVAVVGIYWKKFSIGRLLTGSNNELPDTQADSAILSFYTAGHTLTKAADGTLDTMRFATYITVPTGAPTSFVDSIATINVLDLPFNTGTHLIGLSKQHKIDRLEFSNFIKANGMEKVELEGDFSDYFDLYAAQGQQVNVREVLEPDAMGYVVDYCSGHFWEINRSELYMVASGDDKEGGNIFEEGRKFVNEIKPALLPGQPGAAVVHHDVPYGEYDGPTLTCPVCNKPMSTNTFWHICPNGHGVLISGRELLKLRDHTITISADASKAGQHGALTCPNCHNPMTNVDYQETGVKIDSCEHCPYRWLDADEITQLSSKI